jgi:rare lipoprotein A
VAAAGASEVSASRSSRGRRIERTIQTEVEDVAEEETPATKKPVASYVSVSRSGNTNLMSGRGLY